MTFRRLTIGHTIALVAALALLLAMAPDWWTDKVGQNERFLQHEYGPVVNKLTGTPNASQEADYSARKHEKNAWQAPGVIDRIILLFLLASAGLAIAAAFVRAGGRRGPPLTAYATIVGLVATLLVAYRIMQPPGLNNEAVVKIGAPLGLICVGLLTLGSRLATLAQREEPATEPPPPPPPPEPQPTPAS